VGNWEIWIARYNLRPQLRTLDYGFLLDMPDRVLPELATYEAVLTRRHLVHEVYNGTWEKLEPLDAQRRLRQRLQEFRARQEARNWPSYTYADWQAYQTISQ
jgi:hypothetical protein